MLSKSSTLLLLALGLATPAMAQQKIPAGRVEEIAKNGACVDEQLTRITDVARVAAGIGYTFVMKPGPHLTMNSADQAGKIDEPIAAFEDATIYGSDPDTRKILISLRDHKLCGWVTPDVLLLDVRGKIDRLTYGNGPTPVMVKDSVFGSNDPANTLNLKIILQTVNVRGGEGIRIFETPGGARLPGSQQIFHIYEVFRIETAVDPETSNKELTRYYLIGWTPEVGGIAGRKKLRGWVREVDLLPWTTRMTAIWEGSGEARGYLDPADIKSGGEPAFRNAAGFTEATRNGITRRFPVLEQFPSEASIRASLGKRAGPSEIESSIEWYRVAVPGEPCEDVGSARNGPAKCKAKGNVEIRDGNNKSGRPLSDIDIMFVIDNTASMKPYLTDVYNAVRDFIQQHDIGDAKGESHIRIGAAVYGDYRGATAGLDKVQFRIEVPLGNPRTGNLERLLKIETFQDDQKDRLEAPFAAVINAARQRAWSDTASFRYLVHIADHGNREKGKKSDEGSSDLVEQISIDEVIAAIKENELIYVPIAVRGASANTANPRNENARKAFLRQAGEINARAADNSRKLQLTYEEKAGDLVEHDPRQHILDALEFGLGLSMDARNAADRMVLCRTVPSAPACKPLPPRVTADDASAGIVIGRVLREQGLAEEAANGLTARQAVSAYYFPARGPDGKPTFTFWVALDKQTMETLLTISQTLCRTIEQRGASRVLKKEILATLEASTGRSFTSPAEAIEKRLFVPASHLSKWTTKDWAAIEREIEEATQANLNKYKKDFCKKATQLRFVVEGVRADDSAFVWSARDRRWDVPVKRKQPFSWNYDAGDGLPFWYVPVEFLP